METRKAVFKECAKLCVRLKVRKSQKQNYLLLPNNEPNSSPLKKASRFQNEFMESSFLPKYDIINCQDFWPYNIGPEILTIFLGQGRILQFFRAFFLVMRFSDLSSEPLLFWFLDQIENILRNWIIFKFCSRSTKFMNMS